MQYMFRTTANCLRHQPVPVQTTRHQLGAVALIALLGASCAVTSTDPAVIFRTARKYEAAGDMEQAATYYRLALERDPGNAIIANNLAVTLANTGDYGLAAVYYRRAVEIDPSYDVARYNLGHLLLHQLGDTAGAAEQFTRVLGLHRNRVPGLKTDPLDALFLLGNAYELSGEFASAAGRYRELIALRPDDAVTARRLADLYNQRMNDPAAALPWYRFVTEVSPEDPVAFNNLAAAHQELGNSERAMEAYRRAIEIDPSYAVALYNLGNLHFERGEDVMAAAMLKRAAAAMPGLSPAHLLLGHALRRQGLHEEAMAAYERYTELVPGDSAGWYYRAVASMHAGRFSEALLYYRNVLAIEPDNKEARKALLRLQ